MAAVRREAYSGLAGDAELDRWLEDEHDALPHTRSYLLIAPGGELAGTIRPSVSSGEFDWPRLQMHHLYPREMEAFEASGKPVIQSSRFGVVPAFRNLGIFPTLSLLRAICGTAVAFGIDRLVTLGSARPTKLRFWARLGFCAAAPSIEHPVDKYGAVLLVGSIKETLRIGRETEQFHTVAEFSRPIRHEGCFPNEV